MLKKKKSIQQTSTTTASLTINKQNGFASLQDLGREQAQHLGFSASGAADEYSFLLANYLLNNPKNTPALELTFAQISFTTTHFCVLVLTGADCQAIITNPTKPEKVIKPNQVFTLFAGDTLNLKQPKRMVHSYLAISGGFIAKRFKGSVAYSDNESALQLFNDQYRQGDKLMFSRSTQPEIANKNKHICSTFHQPGLLTLRFMANQSWFALTPAQQNSFIQQTYTVSANSNRMGYRLTAEKNITDSFNSQQYDQYKRLSKAVNYGSIQLPPSGQAIILMKEHQTIGGYPVLGTIMKTDLFRLSQKRPGEKIQFITVSVAKAQQQLNAFYQKFA